MGSKMLIYLLQKKKTNQCLNSEEIIATIRNCLPAKKCKLFKIAKADIFFQIEFSFSVVDFIENFRSCIYYAVSIGTYLQLYNITL